ncbi:MAG: hypothetical protein ACWA5W_03260 [Phycisphaerales bacterium]
MKTKSLIALATLTAISSIAAAQHADMLLIRDDSGNLLTGLYDFDSNSIVSTNTRVFEGEFDQFGTTDEPGFNALSATNIPAGYQALPSSSEVSFNANAFAIDDQVSNLYYWDGNGDVDFVQSTNILTISKAPSTIFNAVLDGGSSDVAGFGIDTTSSDGFLHKHLDAGLTDISESAHGFYLWSYNLTIDGSTSDSVFFVHDFGVENEVLHEAAIDWVGANLVPSPGSLSMLAIGGLVGMRRRR